MRRTTFGGRENWRRLLYSPDSSKLPWSSYGLVRSDEEITQRQEPVHEDLDAVIELVKQHKSFEEDLKNKTKQVNNLSILLTLGNCRKGGCCHDQGPDDWTYKPEEKAKTILNPEKTPQYVNSLKSEEQQETHILSQRKHTLSHRNKETQGERILPNWEEENKFYSRCCHSGLKWLVEMWHIELRIFLSFLTSTASMLPWLVQNESTKRHPLWSIILYM